MKSPKTVKSLEDLGRVQLSKSFFMRDFLHSEISQIENIPNIPDNPNLAIEAGKAPCDNVPAYSSMYFYPKLAAFNIPWHHPPPKRIDSYVEPKGCLTKPDMPNHNVDHSDLYEEFERWSEINE